MLGDALAVLALAAGFLAMIFVGVWARLDDETRAEIARSKGELLASAGAAVGVLFLVI
ncbi:MAG: hypothetical protein ACM3O5_06315 [Betaproteobacteria bacterium]